MGRKGVVVFIAGASLLAIVAKYVYLIIPAVLTITIMLIVRRKKLREQGAHRIVYVRRR